MISREILKTAIDTIDDTQLEILHRVILAFSKPIPHIINLSLPMLQLQEQYITNVQGDRIAVILNIEAYQKLLDEMDEFLCWRGYQQAVEETDSEIANGDFVTLDSYLAAEL